ncbi:hypothetical protein K458DRAFT_161685 [Lentithecium fluviatile CBS 122367]|uniref:Uncharacterized protein n=1 Tax=Lentithecium fluviatile CBS 122367 TaxID=1168545 RepID=A0A6G1IGJ2_9PLEO|nr:hypothetical protein K458DRAFT_161685 [Lentithecium fluviatile CBS 122367]
MGDAPFAPCLGLADADARSQVLASSAKIPRRPATSAGLRMTGPSRRRTARRLASRGLSCVNVGRRAELAEHTHLITALHCESVETDACRHGAARNAACCGTLAAVCNGERLSATLEIAPWPGLATRLISPGQHGNRGGDEPSCGHSSSHVTSAA